MKALREYAKKIYLGTVNGEKIYLSAPSWDCGWYWGFGYLGNNNCHYHVDGLRKDVNLYDGFKKHFGNSFVIKESDIWVFAELFQTFYSLRETAELLGRGGSHLTTNPCSEIIINKSETERINNVVLPAIFDEIYKVIERNADNKSTFDKLVKINLKGDTSKVIKFMKEKGIKTDDLKNIEGLDKYDLERLHSAYWKDFHANK